MPIMYEYKCRDCGHEFEELAFSEEDVPACPKCGHAKSEKLLSACRHKSGGASSPDLGTASSASSGGSCSSCSGGNCSTCGG